ncbi:MAG: hypothetical protein ABIG95_02685 [Candidatus Woesearchaeota archaeon]
MGKLINLIKDIVGRTTEVRFTARLFGVWGNSLHFYTDVPKELEKFTDKEVEIIIRRRL